MNSLLKDLNQNLFSLQKSGVFLNKMSDTDLLLIEVHALKESLLLKEFYKKINENGLESISEKEIIEHESRSILIKKIIKSFCPDQTMKLLGWEKELSLIIDQIRPKITELKDKGYEFHVSPLNFVFEICQFGQPIFAMPMTTMDEIFYSFPIKYDESLYLFISMIQGQETLSTIRESFVFSHFLKSLKK